MIDKPQKHPFLRQRTSWFEVFTVPGIEEGEEVEVVRELQWKEYNRMKLHPEAVTFWGKDTFYNVVTITTDGISKGRLREIATDIYHGKFQRREVNLRRF